jgi:hypothetical protein
VLAHPLPLRLVQLRGLAQDGVRHANLPYVVEQGAELQGRHLRFRQAQLAPQAQAELDDALRVAVRLRVARFERGRQRLERRAVSVFERREGAVQLHRALLDQLFEVILVAALGLAQPVVFERAADCRLDLTEVEGLHDVIERAEPQRLDGALDGLHPADHDDDRLGREREDMRDHFEPAHPAHRDVADDQVALFRAEVCQRLLGRGDRRALVIEAE